MNEERIFIRFEGVGQEAEIFENVKNTGKHLVGYSAFCYEVTNAVNSNKKNKIAIKVTNVPNFKRIPLDDTLFNYYGEIYPLVPIFSTPKTNITPLYYASSRVFAEVKNSTNNNETLAVRAHTSNRSSDTKSVVKFTIKNAQNKLVITEQKEIELSKENQIVKEELVIKNPILWNARNNPILYTFEVEISSNN